MRMGRNRKRIAREVSADDGPQPGAVKVARRNEVGALATRVLRLIASGHRVLIACHKVLFILARAS